MDRRSILIAFLAGAWLATVAALVVPGLGLSRAHAEDPPRTPPRQPFGPNGPNLPGPTVNPIDEPSHTRPASSYGGGTSDSNHTAIALAASIGNGESAVYYFDTEAKRVLVYQYRGVVGHNRPLGARDDGGLRLLAARHIDYDLKLESYRDLSEKTRGELKDAFESAFAEQERPQTAASHLPHKRVNLPGGLR